MSENASAEEHLRVIRSLMERATVYRAISTHAALLGGLLACAAAALTYGPLLREHFLLTWCVVLLIAMAANFFFLQQEAARRHTSLFSAGMRMAAAAMTPPLALGLVATVLWNRSPDALAAFWLITYGLALLATAHFAPRSLLRLGLAFLASGLGYLVLVSGVPGVPPLVMTPDSRIVMGLTFGLLHLLYAACTWPKRT